MRPACSLLSPLFAGLAVTALCIPVIAAEPAASVTFVRAAPAGADCPSVTAIGMRAAPSAPAPATELIVLIDTSATQTGTHRQRSLDAVAGILASARADDRYALTAVDVTSVALCEGLHAAGSETVREAVRKLDARTPLGTTDIVAAVEEAIAQFSGTGPRSIIYIGNGPGLGGIDAEEFARVVDLARSSKVTVSAIGIGPQVNWQCLGALAANSGGSLLILEANDSAREVGGHVGTLAVNPVRWPGEMALENQAADGVLRMLPTRFPPLRSDRDSIVLLEGRLQDAKLEVSLDGQSVTLPIPTAEAEVNNAYLSELARNARASDGLFLPLAGRDGLSLTSRFIRGEAASLAALAAQAKASGAQDSAIRLAEASLRRDPTNEEAVTVRKEATAVRQATATRQASMRQSPDELPPPPAGGRDDELLELDRERRVRGQLLMQDAAVRIRESRKLLETNPDQSREDLKALQLEVQKSEDLDPAGRSKLLSELEMRIREAIVRAREKTERDLARERQRAAGRVQMQLTTDLQRSEEKIRQLTEKYNALVEEGIRVGYAQAQNYPAVIDGEAVIGMEAPTQAFVEAERVAGEEIARAAPRLYSNGQIPMTARLVGVTAPIVARMLDYDAQNFRTRRDQQRGFVDQLHLADVAAIPFSDEPPIVYPSGERWRDITKLREKYKSVDLANPGSKEKDIYDALERQVQRWEFNESPLRDVQRAIADEFRIQVEIDARALEDAGLDLDAPVTQNASGISLRAALRRLLSGIDLAYVVKDEVLLITTKEKADENLVVKVYPVADLVLPVDPGSGLNPFQSGGGLGGANSINSGQNQGGGMGGAAGGQGMGGMGGGGFCWVAREVYGVHDPRWLLFRSWLTNDAPEWLFRAYAAHGEDFASWLRTRPMAKRAVRMAMDIVVEGRQTLPAGVALQVTGARARLADRSLSAVIPTAATIDPESTPSMAPTRRRMGLPAEVLESPDLRAALSSYLQPAPTKPSDAKAVVDVDPKRLEQLRISAAELGEQKDYKRAADLLSAAIACGHAEPWMYESLAIALAASGSPQAEVERALLSAADFATSPAELMQLAYYLSRYGSEKQAVRICRRITRADPTNREAFALAMTLADKSEDISTLRWACPGVLAHDWPASQEKIAKSAGRLANATIGKLRQEGRNDEATAFQAALDAALVRDLVIDIAWTGDADVDIAVLEPTGGMCSTASTRSAAGGVLFADGEAGSEGPTHRERYVVSEAYPGDYKVLVRRAWGNVAADKVTVKITSYRGTKSEQIQKKQVPLGAEDAILKVVLPEGRRREPIAEARIAQDVASQQTLGRAMLAQQLAAITDPEAYESVAKSRTGSNPYGPPQPGLPFVGPRGAVGYQPVITTLPEGVNLFARAVVSADRRYVRITSVPLFSGVGNVTTFNFASGNTQNTTAQSAGGGGFQGAGGVPAGGGGGGAGGAAGGAGGAAGGAGGAAGGAGGAAGGAGGAAGGAGGLCWVAREVYGEANPRWLLFRAWLTTEAPAWLRDAYVAHGEDFAAWIHDRPAMKAMLRVAMDRVIESHLPSAAD